MDPSRRSSEEELVQRVASAFRSTFGYAASCTIQAPGRVNLIGEHTDYNGGFVLPCAIDFQTVISAAARSDRQVRVVAADYENELDVFSLTGAIGFEPQKPWANYVRGVVQCLQGRGKKFAGADLAIGGNIPQGAGLSSSAALEVAVGQVFNELHGLGCSPTEIARIGQQAENEFVGCRCGIMDQLVSARGQAGHAVLIDCRDLATTAVPIPEGISLVIIDSNIRRGLVDSEYNARRAQCEEAARVLGVSALREVSPEVFDRRQQELEGVIARRARHVVSENARTLGAAKALAAGDLPSLGRLMAASHASLRDDFEVSLPQIDALVAIAQEAIGERGGARMTGGGFGGCVVCVLPSELSVALAAAVEKQYPLRCGLQATVYICQAARGACRIETGRA